MKCSLSVLALSLICLSHVNQALADDIEVAPLNEVVDKKITQNNFEKDATEYYPSSKSLNEGKLSGKSIGDGLAEKNVIENKVINKPIIDTSEKLIAELVDMRSRLDTQLQELIKYQDSQRKNPYGPFGYYDFLNEKNIKKTENGYTYSFITKGKGGLAAKGQLVKMTLVEKLTNGKVISKTDGVTFRYSNDLPLFIRDLLQDIPRGSQVKLVALAKDIYKNEEFPISIEKNTSLEYDIHILTDI